MEKLSDRLRRALIICLEDGPIEFGLHYWTGKSERRIEFKTIMVLYERFLVKIIIENRGRGNRVAELTELGEGVARDLKRQNGDAEIREVVGLIARSL